MSLFQFSFVNILFLVPGDISHMCCFLKKPEILLDSFSLFLKTTFCLNSNHDARHKSGHRFSLLPFQVPFRSTTVLCKCIYVLGTKNSSYRKLDREECLSHPHPLYPLPGQSLSAVSRDSSQSGRTLCTLLCTKIFPLSSKSWNTSISRL